MQNHRLQLICKHSFFRLVKSLPGIITIIIIQLAASICWILLNNRGTSISTDYSTNSFTISLLCGLLLVILIFNNINERYLDSIFNSGKLMAYSNVIVLVVISLIIVLVNMLIMPLIKFGDALSNNLISYEYFVSTFSNVMLEGFLLFISMLGFGGLIILMNKLFGKYFYITLIIVLIIGILFLIFIGEIMTSKFAIYLSEHLWAMILSVSSLAIISVSSSFAIIYNKREH